MRFPTHSQTLKTDMYMPVYVHIVDTDAVARCVVVVYVYAPESDIVLVLNIYIYIYLPSRHNAALRRIDIYTPRSGVCVYMYVDAHIHVRFLRFRVRWKGHKQTFPTKKTKIKNNI